MQKVFLVHAVHQQPVLLLVNGHASHLTLDLIDLASKTRCYSFLSTSSHNTCVTTPGCCSIKDQFYLSLCAFCFIKRNFVVRKKKFASIVKEPFEKAFSMTNIRAGFKKCGIFTSHICTSQQEFFVRRMWLSSFGKLL